MGAADDRRRRAEERRGRAALHKTTLKAVEADLSGVTGAEAISLLSQLTRESWHAAGREIPGYTRADTPYRFVPWPPR